MGRITLDELRADLEGCISRVRRGEQLLVVEEEAEVMRLQPAAEEGPSQLDKAAQADRCRAVRALLARPRPKVTASLLEAVLEDRRSGR